MEHWDEGVYVIRSKGALDATPLIVSAGVHGDETAPVQALEQILQALEQRRLIPRRPVMLIFANPAALVNQKRFVKTNLNRLFGLTHRIAGYETTRAANLEAYCRDFTELYGIGWHLDLHATIKPSRHANFALMPASDRHYDDSWSPLLAHHHFTALVRQTSPAPTFANYTCTQLGFESFTLECGAIGTDAAQVVSMLCALLHKLLDENPFAALTTAQLQRFTVALDIIKRHADFTFLIDEQCENFSIFSSGTPIAQDGPTTILTPSSDCALLFANSQVPIGDRAGLLLQPL